MTLTAAEAWTMTLGERDAATVVAEFGLTDAGPGLDEWLGTAEQAAAEQHEHPEAFLAAVGAHHQAMLAELRAAL